MVQRTFYTGKTVSWTRTSNVGEAPVELGVGQQTHRTLGRVLVLPSAPWDASGEEDWVFEE